MKRRKIKLLASIVSLVLIAAVASFGVFAATTHSVGVKTMVSFTTAQIDGSITATVTGLHGVENGGTTWNYTKSGETSTTPAYLGTTNKYIVFSNADGNKAATNDHPAYSTCVANTTSLTPVKFSATDPLNDTGTTKWLNDTTLVFNPTPTQGKITEIVFEFKAQRKSGSSNNIKMTVTVKSGETAITPGTSATPTDSKGNFPNANGNIWVYAVDTDYDGDGTTDTANNGVSATTDSTSTTGTNQTSANVKICLLIVDSAINVGSLDLQINVALDSAGEITTATPG